jgi:hypothetical protein
LAVGVAFLHKINIKKVPGNTGEGLIKKALAGLPMTTSSTSGKPDWKYLDKSNYGSQPFYTVALRQNGFGRNSEKIKVSFPQISGGNP